MHKTIPELQINSATSPYIRVRHDPMSYEDPKGFFLHSHLVLSNSISSYMLAACLYCFLHTNTKQFEHDLLDCIYLNVFFFFFLEIPLSV